MTVQYLGPEKVKPSVEARQTFYDALSEVARSEYVRLVRVGRAAGSTNLITSMSSFADALESFPAWFAEHGLVPKPGFDTSIFVNDAIESMVRQAIGQESFRLRAFRWSYEGDHPSVQIDRKISHPMVRPSLDAETSTHSQTWSMTELRDSAVDLFKNQLDDWLNAVYDHAKATGVIAKEAHTLERDMKRLVLKQVLGYSPAEIVALEQEVRPSELENLDRSDIEVSDVRAVDKAINAAAERLGLQVRRLRPGRKRSRSTQKPSAPQRGARRLKN